MNVKDMVWVHTFEIGTNAGRKLERKVYYSLREAEAQQEVLGGRIREYVDTETLYNYKRKHVVKWPENLSADEVARMIRRAEHSSEIYSAQYLCQPAEMEGVIQDPFHYVRKQHAEWSDRQFGNVGPIGSLKHLAKEAIEAAEAPDDISEFADIIMLVWDSTRRAGISDHQLAKAVAEKLERNKRREWGSVQDGEPCYHLKK